MQYQDFLISSLVDTADIARDYFGKVTGVTKAGDNNQVLTQADLAIGHVLIQRVKEYFPKHNIIDEETGVIDNHSEFTWVIDPIDGTSNFASGIPNYGSMIGLLYKNQPIAGRISLPAFNKILVAEKGQGTFCDNNRLKVTRETNLLSILVAYHIDGHQENPEITKQETSVLANIILGIRNLRIWETCYDVALLAEGKIGGYLTKSSKIWDNVAPQIIIEEAGGVYTDFLGNPIEYSNPLSKAKNNFTVCAASPNLHKQLQQIIHSS